MTFMSKPVDTEHPYRLVRKKTIAGRSNLANVVIDLLDERGDTSRAHEWGRLSQKVVYFSDAPSDHFGLPASD